MWTLFDYTVRPGTVVRRENAVKGTCQVTMTDALSTTRDQVFFMLEDVSNINTNESDMMARPFTARFVH